MEFVIIMGILSVVFMFAIHGKILKREEKYIIKDGGSKLGICIIMLSAFLLRIWFGITAPGYETDTICFQAWSSAVYEHGFSEFYKLDMFSDYPPGYMYVLWVVGFVKSFAGDNVLLVRLPAILADMAAGFWIYKLASKSRSGWASCGIASLFLFSPAVLLNSAIWGQVDIFYGILAAVALYFLSRKMLVKSYLAFALAVLVKPQALIFAPVFLFEIIDNYINSGSLSGVLQRVGIALCGVLVFVLLCVPFGVKEVLNQYILTIDSYPHATVNAFNIFGAFNLNWDDLTPVLTLAGMAGIAFTVLYSAYCFIKGNRNCFFLGGMIVYSVFMLSTRMHERYAYPAMIMFLLAYVTSRRREAFYMFVLTTFSQIINTGFVLFVSQTDINLYAKSPIIVVFSVVNLVILGYMLYAGVSASKAPVKREFYEWEEEAEPVVCVTEKVSRLTKKDFILISAICLVYGAVSFINLGSMSAPQTYEDISAQPVEITLDEPTYIDKIVVYNSCNDLDEDRMIDVTYGTADGEETVQYSEADPFKWEFLDFGKEVSYLHIGTENPRIMLMEIGLLTEDGLMEITSDSKLFDEQYLIPERATYMNGTYFDEIYHARTGYEFIHGFNVYEWTHPPLGKVFISAGIKAFGMTPFGWRFAGNIFGILMLPVLYIFAKRMFRKTYIAFFATLLFALDFMHFTQTRISTIDVYGTFFIMLMYGFMYRYYTMSFYDTPLRKTFVPLLLTGIAFGLGAASKWTAIYGCMGIAVIFFGIMYKRYTEREMPGCEGFRKKFVYTCLFCVLAFIVIPVCIYGLSYIPYLMTENTEGLKTIIENQRDMFVYHADTVVSSEHPYASKWYTWLIMIRPIFYYSGDTANGLKEGISAFGNPAVWWVGLSAVLFNIYLAVILKDKKSMFLLVGYFACLIPWIPIERTTFIYHYFPCVPFMVMMIGRAYEYLDSIEFKGTKRIFAGHVIIALILFVMFYPVISGHPVSEWFVDTFLKWFRGTWTLVL